MHLKTHKSLLYVAIFSALMSGCGGGESSSAQQPTQQKSTTQTQAAQSQNGSLSIQVNSLEEQSSSNALQNHLTSGVVGQSEVYQRSRSPVLYASAFGGGGSMAAELSTLKPQMDFTASNYIITGQGPENAQFNQTLSASSNIQLDFLRFGQWDINVQAENADSEQFATGSTQVEINVGEVTNAVIDLALTEGTGSFTLDLEFPENSVQGEVMSALLKPETGEPITLTLQPGPAKPGFKTYTATLNNTVPSGYYTLIVTVHDEGDNGQQRHLTLGVAETVQILADQTTVGQYSLKGAAGLGSVGFEFNLDLNENLPVTMIGSDSYTTTFPFDSDTSFTASATLPANDDDVNNVTYVWYLNGQVVGVNTSSYTVDARVSPFTTSVNGRFIPGHYRLDVVAFNADASRSGSASFEFDVTGNPVGNADTATLSSRVGQLVTDNGITRFSAVPGAQISLSGRTINADENGHFTLESAPVGAQVLSIVAPGFIPFHKRVELAENGTLSLDKITLTQGTTKTFNATQPTQVDIAGDLASIDFAANSIGYENGDLYEGQVTVQYTALNPLSEQFYSTFPGEFKGQTADGELVDIISYGVIAAELSDDNGTPLQLRDGQSAEIRIKVANPATAPETMPLWHLNEETGTWVHQGNATLTGDYYVGQVGHFSWWNFDYRLDGERATYRNMTVTVKDAVGQVIPNAQVTLTSKAGFSYQQTYTTNQQGRTSAKALFTESATKKPDSLFYEISATYQDWTSGTQTLRFFPDRWSTVDQDGNEFALNDVTLTLQEQLPAFYGEALLSDARRPLVDQGASLIFTEDTPSIELSFTNEGTAVLNINEVTLQPAGKYRLPSSLTGALPLQLNGDESVKFKVTYLGDFSTHDKAILKVENNSLNNQIDIPFAAVAQLDGLYLETREKSMLHDHQGIITKAPYTDSYQGGVIINHGLNSYGYLYENENSHQRAYMAYDLSDLPKNARITTAKLVFSRFNSPQGVHVYLSDHERILQPEDFALPCDTATEACLLTTLPAHTNSAFTHALSLTEIAKLEAINNGSERQLKLMLVNIEGNLTSYFSGNDIKLEIEYAQ